MADFQVYMIEAPAAKDVYDQRGEGELIRESLEFRKSRLLFALFSTTYTFKKALLEGWSL